MPDIEAAVSLPWAAAASVQRAAALPWGSAATIQSVGGAYTPPAPPPGGTPSDPPGTLPPVTRIDGANSYLRTHSLSVIDLRDGQPLPVERVQVALDDGSVHWTLSANGAGTLFATLTEGEQPATVEVRVDGIVWQFVVETVSRPRAFAADAVSFGGRSLAAGAGAPYEFERHWIGDAPTTAAQIVTAAQTVTGLTVVWAIEDWLVPAGALSFFGTPLAVVQHVAQAAGAVVTAARVGSSVTVSARYPVLFPEWPCQTPDVQLPFEVIESETYERADQPAYNAVLLSGQQQGALGYVRLYGTSGSDHAPMVTDPLLTDEPALRQRGQAILGAAGAQARITRTLPVLTGEGEPGVIERGALVRCVDPSGVWFGLVRSVSVSAELPRVSQTIVLERHTGAVPTGEVERLTFSGPIPTLNASVGSAFTQALGSYWAGGTTPYTFSRRSGTLPAGLTLDAATGTISGTPTQAGTETGVAVRCVDAEFQQADSNAFDIVVAPATVALLLHGDGAPSAQVFTDSSPNNWTPAQLVGSIFTEANGSAFGGSAIQFAQATGSYLRYTAPAFLPSASSPFTVECFVQLTSKTAADGYADGRFSFLRLVEAGVKKVEFSAAAFANDKMLIATPSAYQITVPSYLNRLHLAVVRNLGFIYIYVNGVELGGAPKPATNFNFTDIYVGNTALTSHRCGGFIEEVRVAAAPMYLGNFTPPTAPL